MGDGVLRDSVGAWCGALGVRDGVLCDECVVGLCLCQGGDVEGGYGIVSCRGCSGRCECDGCRKGGTCEGYGGVV